MVLNFMRGIKMKEMFERVQEEFKGLESFLNRRNLKKELAKPEILAELNDALSDTYVLLNQGFCENVRVCEKCAENRDQLRALVESVDLCEEKKELSDEVYASLETFRQNIPKILQKMQSVYKENLLKSQA